MNKSNTFSVPRAQWKKLWNWCRKHTELEGNRINVRVLSSFDYGVLRDEQRVRMGRAIPCVRVFRDESDKIKYSDITWSYVN